MFAEFILTLLVVAVGGAALSALQQRHPRDEVGLLFAGFVQHVLSVMAQVWVINEVYGGGDIEGYYRSGVELANGLRQDFSVVAPEMLKIFFHDEEFWLPFQLFGGANATGSLTVVAAVLFYFFGDSLYAASMAVSVLAYFGKLAMFYALEGSFPAHLRRRVLIGTTLTPSVAFWSATIAKEAVVVAFLGFATLILSRILRRRLGLLAWVPLLSMLAPVAMIKPYVLIAFSVAAGAWLYWEQSRQRGSSIALRPAYLLLGALIASGGLYVVGRLSPQFAVDNIVKSTASVQASGAKVEGGSYYRLGEAPAEDESLGRQVWAVPLALPTALFRPLLIEVKNPMMFLNAVETTFLLVLVARMFLNGRLKKIIQSSFANPALAFCFTFTVLLGTSVGLASTNLGSLSRYRMPFMPFFVTLVLVLDAMRKDTGKQTESTSTQALTA